MQRGRQARRGLAAQFAASAAGLEVLSFECCGSWQNQRKRHPNMRRHEAESLLLRVTTVGRVSSSVICAPNVRVEMPDLRV